MSEQSDVPTQQQQWQHQSVVEFVEQYLADSLEYDHWMAWCPCWWDHPEALIRLDMLWRSWETAQLTAQESDPTAMSQWQLQHADPHLRWLLHKQGPFARCYKEGKHVEPEHSLPTQKPRADTFGAAGAAAATADARAAQAAGQDR